MTSLNKKKNFAKHFCYYALLVTFTICCVVMFIGSNGYNHKESIKIDISSPLNYGDNWYSEEQHKIIRSNFIYIPENSTIHLSKQLPQDLSEFDCLMIWNFYNHVTVSSGSKLLYTGGTKGRLRFGNEYGGIWQIIPLKKAVAGEMLTLKITNISNGRNFYLSSFYFGSKNQLILQILHMYKGNILGIILILAVSIILIFYSLVMQRYGINQYTKLIHALIILSLDFCIYILLESSLSQFLISNPSFKYISSYIVSWISPVLIIIFYRHFFEEKYGLLLTSTNIYIALVGLWFILYALNLVHLDYFYIVYIYSFAVFFAVSKTALKEFRETHDGMNLIAAIALCILFISGIAGVTLYYTNSQAANIQLYQDGYIIFLIILMAIVLKRTFNTIAKASTADYYRELAYSDAITGGHSKAYFEQTFPKLLTKNSYFIFMNFKRFKIINEILGFEKSNQLLKKLYTNVKLTLKDNEIMCNLDNAHFGILIHAENESEIFKRCDKIIKAYSYYIGEAKMPYKIRTEFGVAKFNEQNNDFYSILDNAIISIRNKYATANLQQNCFIFEDACKQVILEEKNLEENFEAALAHHEFKLYLQPKIDLKTNRIVCAEALARWESPDRGILSPSEFIPILEKLGKIEKLDIYLFNQTCLLIKQWLSEDIRMPKIAINLSHMAINSEGYFDNYVKIIKGLNLSGNNLEFEISENSTYDNLEHLKEVINTIHEIGAVCTLDDFGKSYSNLSLLGAIDFDNANLAPSFFVEKAQQSPKHIKLINATISMLKSMNLKISAIGIEAKGQLDALKNYGFDYAQGFAISKPLTVYEFENFVKAYKVQG